MNIIQNTFKNASWLISSQIITGILGFVWTMLIARYLGVTDWGILSTALYYTNIMTMFVDLGISTYITREVSKYQETAELYLRNGIPIKICLSLISFFGLILLMSLMGYSEININVTIIIAISVAFNSMGSIVLGIIQAYGKMEYQGISIILNSSLLFFGFIIAIFLNLGLIGVALIYSISSVLTIAYLYIICSKKLAKIGMEFNIPLWKEMIKKGIPFGVTAIFTVLFYTIDGIMLSVMSGNYAVGIYSSAYKIISVFTTLYSVYIAVFFPLMSKLHKEDKELLIISYEKSIKYLLILIVPIAIVISLYSEYIIILLFGISFKPSSSVLLILIWSLIFTFLNGASTNLLNASDRETIVTKINGIGAFVNVVLNLTLIPIYSYNGASVATVLTGIILCILFVYNIKKIGLEIPKNIIKDIIKILIANLMILAVLMILNLNLFIAIPVTIIVYIIGLFVTRLMDDNDRDILKALKK